MSNLDSNHIKLLITQYSHPHSSHIQMLYVWNLLNLRNKELVHLTLGFKRLQGRCIQISLVLSGKINKGRGYSQFIAQLFITLHVLQLYFVVIEALFKSPLAGFKQKEELCYDSNHHKIKMFYYLDAELFRSQLAGGQTCQDGECTVI